MYTQPIPTTDFFDLAAIPVALLLSILVNRLVAYFFTPVFVRMKWDRELLMYVAAVLGFALAWFAQINLLPAIFPNPLVGQIVSAVIVGGGANLIHDIIKSLGGAFGGTLMTEELSFASGALQTQEVTIQQPATPVGGTAGSIDIQVNKE